ncbi:uncharacterized protein [Panulirus ornatus]|uniref:uncharacterized protein n=1 Tax=Panulirus ornatus TaxID=150431 RepID=UPI003A854DA7
MPSSRQLLTLLTVVATGSLMAGAFDCPIDEGFTCSSCTTLVYCSEGKPFLEHPCDSDKLCGGDPPKCRRRKNLEGKDCKCKSYPSYLEDPYDERKFLACLSQSLQMSGSCPDGQVFDEADPPCAVKQPLECPETGMFPVLPGCGGYYACLPDASGALTPTDVIDCEGKKIFHPEKQKCVRISTPSDVTCTAGQVAVADTVECNAFHICNGEGEPVRGPFCCPNEGHVFHGETLKCEPDTGAVKCPTPNPCPGSEAERFCLPSITTTPTTDSTTTTESTTTTPGSTSITTESTSTTTESTTTTAESTTTTTESTTTTAESTSTTAESTTTTAESTTTTSASIPDCKNSGTGAYPIPGECKRYYYCFLGKLYTLTCSGKLVFNPNNKTCDLPSNYPECA